MAEIALTMQNELGASCVDGGVATLALATTDGSTDKEYYEFSFYTYKHKDRGMVRLHEIAEHPAELAAYFAERPHERTLAYSYAIKEAIPKVDRANKLAAALIVALVKEPIDFLASSSSISNHMAISLTTSWR